MASPYKYTRIDLATDAIRLVTLRKGEQYQPIECEIFETYLHQVEGVPYEALSYVWGTEESADMIKLNGHQFELTENLHEALVHLRRPDEDRVLWIDAICIDQRHDSERGHQVGQMRVVYQTAQRVIIWLGPSDSHIDCLFDWMNDLDQQVLAVARPHTIGTWENQWSWLVWELRGQPPPDEIKEALSALLQRKWFSRIWVLQEAALARSAMVTCGRKEANSRVFVVMPSLLNVNCGEREQTRLDILPGLLRQKSWWAESSSKDLVTLLQKFGRSEASDPRDIIYALLGLSGDAHSSELLRPNYEISVEGTVQQSIAYFMLQTHCLSERTAIQSLPRWSISDFLDKLDNLSFHVFKWAADYAKDTLLYDLILSQKENLLTQPSHPYMDYRGTQGPLITIAVKKANSALSDLILTLPGMDVVSTDSGGRTPMSLTMDQGNISLARSILEYRRHNFHEKDPNYSTALWLTAQEGSRDSPKLFRVDPQFAFSGWNLNSNQPLLVATKLGDRATVEAILSHSHVDLSVVDANGDGPLNIAARRGDEHIIDLLLQSISRRQAFWSIVQDLQFRGSDGLTPFELALVSHVPGAIKKLLVYNRDAVYHAVEANHFEVLRVILDVDPSLADSEWDGFGKPLSCAAQIGNASIASLLLDNGADINSRDRDERNATPLWLAASCGHVDTVKLLVERGADIELMANEGPLKTTALWAAASKGYTHTQVVMYLLKAGANVEKVPDGASNYCLKDCPGSETVLWAATWGGHTGAVKTLTEGGVNLEFYGPSFFDQPIEPQPGWRATRAKKIWIAASQGYADIVRLLIEHGADIESRDTYFGMTPFVRAAEQELTKTMEVLQECGADTSAKAGW